jgi:imidazolonepropionase-like amidohydrolase
MRQRTLLLLLSIWLCACGPTDESHTRAILGAVLIDGLGGPPVSDSVVVTAGDRIREAGLRSAVLIPDEADKIDGGGKFVVPALVDVYAKSAEADNFTAGHPATAEAAREQVARLARRKVNAIHMWKLEPAVAQATLEAARDAAIPVIGHIATQAEVRALVDGGASGFVGMIGDTEELDPALLARLRDLHIFFAPALSGGTAPLDVAKRNTRRLFAAGVPIALASSGGDPIGEAEQLVDAGIPPLDAIVAATRNSAAALGELDGRGTVQAGKRADLLLLSANPGDDIRNLRKVALRIVDGNVVR